MSNLNEKVQNIMNEIENNISNENEREFINKKIAELSVAYLEEIQEISKKIENIEQSQNTLENKIPVIPFENRKAIVEAIRYVDEVVAQTSMNKLEAWEKLHFDVMFHGSDWKGSEMFNIEERKLKEVGCETVFLPHTDGISSTILAPQSTKSVSD